MEKPNRNIPFKWKLLSITLNGAGAVYYAVQGGSNF